VTTADVLYLAFIAIGLSADHFLLWPAFLRRSHTDPGQARVWLWSRWMILLWTLVATGVALWLFDARTWEALRLTIPYGWQLWSTIGLVIVVAIPNALTVIRITRSGRSKRIKVGNPDAEKLSPHTRPELAWFVALSLSAGFCEEFIYRGYLIWAFQPVFGLWGAAAFSVVAFAMSHAYQGVKGILSTGIIGGLLTLVVLISGSILPAVALHAVIDIGQGLVAWLVFRQKHDEGDMVAA
jgi:membrane protease YdiL (CAAX protease family)